MSAAVDHGARRDPVEPSDIHVLLVDDERLSRIVVGGLLRKCSYRGKSDATHSGLGRCS